MSSEQEANDAIAELNGSFWHGRRVHMERQNGRGRQRNGANTSSPGSRDRRSDLPSEPTRFLYIGNIPYESTDAELNKMFRGLDNLEDVRVAVDRVTGFPRGFAHADFTDVESARRAFEKLSGFDLGGRALRVDYAGNSTEHRKGGGRSGGRRDRGDRGDRTNRDE